MEGHPHQAALPSFENVDLTDRRDAARGHIDARDATAALGDPHVAVGAHTMSQIVRRLVATGSMRSCWPDDVVTTSRCGAPPSPRRPT